MSIKNEDMVIDYVGSFNCYKENFEIKHITFGTVSKRSSDGKLFPLIYVASCDTDNNKTVLFGYCFSSMAVYLYIQY